MTDGDGQRNKQTLAELLSPEALKLLSAGGSALVEQIGVDVVRDVIFNVLTGKNLRDSTEVLTRRRIAALNLAMVNLFLHGTTDAEDFVNLLLHLAADILSRPRISKSERWLAQWMIGLTGKAVQNVLRDNPELVAQYRDTYIEACREVVSKHSAEYGELAGSLETMKGKKAKVDWLFLAYLLNAIGAQTLTIRGSEKSAYGKLFEKLILGSLLYILDFKYTQPGQPTDIEQVFWLSQRNEKRESDATLLYSVGRGVRFDIGFIGRGNPEISLDKVSRFEREISLGSKRYYMATIIIVDRIGRNSRIERLAKDIDGIIVQMSAGYWPQQVARELQRIFGFQHELINMNSAQIEAYLKKKLAEVPIETLLRSTSNRPSTKPPTD